MSCVPTAAAAAAAAATLPDIATQLKEISSAAAPQPTAIDS
jgi:hypothetical protein